MEHEIDIKAARDVLRMTQAQLADAIGVDQSTVSNWERGAAPRGPARKLLERLLAEAAPAPKTEAA